MYNGDIYPFDAYGHRRISDIKFTKIQKTLFEFLARNNGVGRLEIARELGLDYSHIHREIKNLQKLGPVFSTVDRVSDKNPGKVKTYYRLSKYGVLVAIQIIYKHLWEGPISLEGEYDRKPFEKKSREIWLDKMIPLEERYSDLFPKLFSLCGFNRSYFDNYNWFRHISIHYLSIVTDINVNDADQINRLPSADWMFFKLVVKEYLERSLEYSHNEKKAFKEYLDYILKEVDKSELIEAIEDNIHTKEFEAMRLKEILLMISSY